LLLDGVICSNSFRRITSSNAYRRRSTRGCTGGTTYRKNSTGCGATNTGEGGRGRRRPGGESWESALELRSFS
jgi:hypothetical protein